MKAMGNRQNKWMQTKAQSTPFQKSPSGSGTLPKGDFDEVHSVLKGGVVFGLVADLLMATRIAKAAKQCHLGVHNFDNAGALISHVREKKPVLIILDWDTREAEAFKVLKELSLYADLKSVATVGYVSGSRESLKQEAQRAGCHRVYGKTEITRDLEYLLARYAQ